MDQIITNLRTLHGAFLIFHFKDDNSSRTQLDNWLQNVSFSVCTWNFGDEALYTLGLYQIFYSYSIRAE